MVVIEQVVKIWCTVLAQQKMPTLLSLGYIPENLWSGKIKNFVLDFTELKQLYLGWMSIKTEFEWEIDNIDYKIESSFLIKQVSLGHKERMFQDIQRSTFGFGRITKNCMGYHFRKLLTLTIQLFQVNYSLLLKI